MKFRIFINKIIANYYKKKIINTAKEVGSDLYIGGKSYVTDKTILSSHVSFNGMAISGHGEVKIGRYFHSGPGCQIITNPRDADVNPSLSSSKAINPFVYPP